MRNRVGALLFSITSLAALTAHAEEPILARSFDPTLGELPESIAFDDGGNLFLSMGNTIRRLTPEGDLEQWSKLPVEEAFALGVKVGPDGCVYNASTSLNPNIVGAFVWRTCEQGAIEEYAALDPSAGPNDLAFDDEGNLFVTDPIGGRIFKVDDAGNTSLFLDHALLKGNPAAPALLFGQQGVNGIAFAKNEKSFYVGNLDYGRILEVALKNDGSFKSIELVAQAPALVGADAMAFDKDKRLWVAVGAQNQLVSVKKNGHVRVESTNALLNGPAGLAFGVEHGDKKTLYIADLDFLKAFGLIPGTPEPNLLTLRTPAAGLPILD
ncbi:MAG TPA: SMP-30/gluconolactonase/LRE family protein [Polyangiales bacterium]|nr:SMP-30/gluconolactonase/LRE family protein [Polyangiales bacterium]